MRFAGVAVLLLVALLLIPPSSALIEPNPGAISGYQEIEISGSSVDVDLSQVGSQYAVSNAYVYGVSPGTTVSLTISRPGESWTGSYRYLHSGVTSNLSVTLEGTTATWGALSPVALGNSFCLRYATDTDANTAGLVLSNVPPFDQDQARYAYLPIPYIDTLPITRIHATTDTGDEIKLVVRYNEASAVGSSIVNYGTATQTNFLAQLLEVVGGFLTVILTLFTVFKFVFLDHFVAVLVLFESVTIAYAASQSRGFIPFIQKFWRYNEGLVTFLLKFMSYVLDFFYRIIQALKPI